VGIQRSVAALIAVLVTVAPQAIAADYHDYFVGFSSELSGFVQSADTLQDTVDLRSFSFSGTYGPPALDFLRFRGGLGWWPRRPFRLFAGIEVPVYEVLNSAQPRVELWRDTYRFHPFGDRADR
jgi:hypothetical protein